MQCLYTYVAGMLTECPLILGEMSAFETKVKTISTEHSSNTCKNKVKERCFK